MNERRALLYPHRHVTRSEPLSGPQRVRRTTWTVTVGAFLGILAVGTVVLHVHPQQPSSQTTATATETNLFPDLFEYWWQRFRYQSQDATEDTINQQGKLHVVDRPGFFGYNTSFSDQGDNTTSRSPIVVSYNARSLVVNGRPLLLLGGSMHPVRHSRATWEAALDEAVAMGLNLVTVYVMWAAHQPTANPFDWRLPGSPLVCSSSPSSSFSNINGEEDSYQHNSSDCWTLATALKLAADRRLWVHLRMGPYVCAEYNYGGIPEWVPTQFQSENRSSPMSMRRPNQPWLTAMQQFVHNVTAYIAANQLWAYQGGNILMAQIENELQGDIDLEQEYLMWVTDDGKLVDYPTERRANLQDYANWCGQLAQQAEPHVVWTMCNGLSAPNTLETFNGVDASTWLARNGSTGRVQVDFPAMFTEFEGGFQIWGDDPDDPSDYFWGQTARDYAAHALRWFARGGTHLNYYMFAGGYNRGRMAAAGITNMYASDAPLCSSGLRRQPKFDHLQKLHTLIRDNAQLLLSNPQRAWPEQVEILAANGTWVMSPSAVSFFRYVHGDDSLIIVENMQNHSVKARWTLFPDNRVHAELNPWSVSLFKNSRLAMDSTQIDPKAKMYRRYIRQVYLPPPIHTEEYPIPSVCGPKAEEGPWPMEQTELMVKSQESSDYAWYATEWNQTSALRHPELVIDTQLSTAFVVFLDGRRAANNNTHPHLEGTTTLSFALGPSLSQGHHRLVVLSESLGYDNVIGVWGASTAPKRKGITGHVYVTSRHGDRPESLTPATQRWCSCTGLLDCGSSETANTKEDAGVYRTTWRFVTPQLTQGERLFVRIRSGRGHFFLNGVDMGRFWNITRQHSGQYSQANYLLPADYLLADENELIMENVLGAPQEDVLLLATHVVPGSPLDFRDMEDIVGFPRACF